MPSLPCNDNNVAVNYTIQVCTEAGECIRAASEGELLLQVVDWNNWEAV